MEELYSCEESYQYSKFTLREYNKHEIQCHLNSS